MKLNRTVAWYGALLVALLVVGVAGVRMSLMTGERGALRRMSRGERAFQEARRELLLTSSDPSNAILEFVADDNNPRNARVQALGILKELAQHQKVQASSARLIPLLKDDSREIRLAALEAIGATETTDGIEAVVDLFGREADTALVRCAADALTGAAKPLLKRLDAAMHNDDSMAVDSCLKALAPLPVGKGSIYPDLGDYYRRKGDVAKAAGYYRRMGVIRTWWIIGAFNSPHMEGWARDYGPESTPFDPTGTFRISDRKQAQWFPFRRVHERWGIWLYDLFEQRENVVAYLFVYLHVPSERSALVLAGSDDALKVWCNDSLVSAKRVFRAVRPDDDVVRIHLRQGVNTLLLKVVQDVGGWGVCCRLADLRGEAMDDVVVSLDKELRPSPAEPVIACIEKGGQVCWNRDSLDVGDMALQRAVIAAIADEGLPDTRRTAALKFLDQINEHMPVPVGERDLVDIATAMAKRGGASALLGRIAESLHWMQTGRALDLGLALRELGSPAMSLAGNRLVSNYCKQRLLGLGDLSHPSDPALAHRAMQEISSLSPTDPWVLERSAAFYVVTGDSAKAGRLASQCAMPRRWYLRAEPKPLAAVAYPARGQSAPPDSSAFFGDSALRQVRNWQLLDLSASAAPYGFYADLSSSRLPGGDQNTAFACTEVLAAAAESCMVAVSAPAQYRLWVNGTELPQLSKDPAARYRRLLADDSQPRRFDLDLHRVFLRPGRNTILLALNCKRFDGVREAYFRCGLVAGDGTGMGCVGNVVSGDRAGK